MAYCTLADIKNKLEEEIIIQLTDEHGLGVIDTGKVNSAILSADAEIDGLVGTRYQVPVSPVPEILRKYSVDISIYNLFSLKRTTPEDVRTRYKDAVAFLTNVSKGVASLGENDPAQSTQDKVEISSADRVFTRDRLKGF
jgi:phage gp36-like protein